MVEVTSGSKKVQSTSILSNNLLHELISTYNSFLDAVVVNTVQKDQHMDIGIHLLIDKLS